MAMLCFVLSSSTGKNRDSHVAASGFKVGAKFIKKKICLYGFANFFFFSNGSRYDDGWGRGGWGDTSGKGWGEASGGGGWGDSGGGSWGDAGYSGGWGSGGGGGGDRMGNLGAGLKEQDWGKMIQASTERKE